MPKDLGLGFGLWGRAAVSASIRRQYGMRLAVRATGTYLARWALPHKSRCGGRMSSNRRRCGIGCNTSILRSWRGRGGRVG
jgi:hypothetical protein